MKYWSGVPTMVASVSKQKNQKRNDPPRMDGYGVIYLKIGKVSYPLRCGFKRIYGKNGKLKKKRVLIELSL